MGRRPVPPQGLQVAHWPGTLTPWDDRWAQAAYKPPTVVFLGDLMDEASEADTEQMDRSVPSPVVMSSIVHQLCRAVPLDLQPGGERHDLPARSVL